jgi:hypothetical protein
MRTRPQPASVVTLESIVARGGERDRQLTTPLAIPSVHPRNLRFTSL